MAEILASLKSNRREAWENFYNTNVNSIYRYVMYRCNNDKTAAEDITQEVFLTAVDKIDSFSGSDEKLTGWLFGITKIEILRYFQRNNKRYVEFSDNSDEFLMANSEPEVYTESEDECVVDQVLGSLAENQREVLVYKYCDRLSVKEISHRTGRSDKAVESLLTRAREAFKKFYKQTIWQEEN